MPQFWVGTRAGRAWVLAAVLLLSCAGLAVHPQRAAACSCRGLSTATALRQADVAFSGEASEVHTVRRPRPGRTEIRFEVDQVYKGTAYQVQVVTSPRDGDDCGLSPQVGTRWVIFAVVGLEGTGSAAVPRVSTTVCSGNVPGGVAPATLGPGRPPLPGASDREAQAIRTDAAIDRWFGFLGIGVVLVAALGAATVALAWRRRLSG